MDKASASTNAGPIEKARFGPSPGLPEWVPVLMYHRVVRRQKRMDPYKLTTSVEDFEAQMRSLKELGYQVIALDDLAAMAHAGVRSRSAVAVITFDDGYMDSYEIAYPVLRQYGYPATVFVISAYIGKSNSWDHDKVEEAPLLGMREITEMLNGGGITIGSHSATHRPLTRLDPSEVRREIADSRDALEQALGTSVKHFCYPYGMSNDQVECAVMEAGYATAAGIEQHRNAIFNISRIDGGKCKGADMAWRIRLSGLYFHARRNPVFRAVKNVAVDSFGRAKAGNRKLEAADT